MGDIPVLNPEKVVSILEKLGFEMVRQRGSHKQYRHPSGRFTTVPFHQGQDISPVSIFCPCAAVANLSLFSSLSSVSSTASVVN
jgi:predicted RNA binding protein YcfA (HicA-like mRNA interferase family)